MRRHVLAELLDVVKEEFSGPLTVIMEILEPFVASVTTFVDLIKEVKTVWTNLVNG